MNGDQQERATRESGDVRAARDRVPILHRIAIKERATRYTLEEIARYDAELLDALLKERDALLAELAALERRIEQHAWEMEDAARNWRGIAKEERANRSTASMSGEHDIPAHIISAAREVSFQAAADSARAALDAAAARGNET
jgi:hypothetical protein